MTPAFGSGTLKFTTTVDGKQTKGELKDIYYLPDIHTRLLSYEWLHAPQPEGESSRQSTNEQQHLYSNVANDLLQSWLACA